MLVGDFRSAGLGQSGNEGQRGRGLCVSMRGLLERVSATGEHKAIEPVASNLWAGLGGGALSGLR